MTPAEIRTAREGLGLTQAQMAEALGTGTKTIEDLEAGRNKRLRLYGLAIAGLVTERNAAP